MRGKTVYFPAFSFFVLISVLQSDVINVCEMLANISNLPIPTSFMANKADGMGVLSKGYTHEQPV